MKGHWPKGKRRHPTPKALIVCLRRVLRHPQPKVVSRRAVALAIGVDQRTVGRWLQEEDHPSPSSQKALRKWLEKV